MTTSFSSLGVAPDLVEALASRGITSPFAIQALALPDGLGGRDVCGKAKTGSGKTLAFGIPMLERAGSAEPGHPTGLVLVPTRELAAQVRDELAPLGQVRDVAVVAVYGGAPMDRQIKELDEGADVVIATPGRLIDLLERKVVALDAVSVLVIDEADRMADMGFLPQVTWLLRRMRSERQTLLFSATLDGAVDHLVQRHMRLPVFHEVGSGTVMVESMTHRFLLVHQMDKVRVCAAIVRSHPRTLLFSRTKRGADRLVAELRKEGVAVAIIHGDLPQRVREKALRDFSEGRLPALVATDVAARGIHVDDVGVVVHVDPPEDHKAYLHRSGRTARAGESGVVVTLLLWDEERHVRLLHKRLGMQAPIIEVFSNDPRLADLVAFGEGSEGEGGGGGVARRPA